MIDIPDAPEIRRAMETGVTGFPCGDDCPVCEDCGEPVGDWSFGFDGLTLCADCCRDRLTDYLDTNFREAAEALGCLATYHG